jgi:hypothetical protein
MKHRAIARERQEAAKEGKLPAWYAKRAAEAPAPPPPAPDFAIQTLEGASWSEESRYMTWTLPRWAVPDARRHYLRPQSED